MSALPKHISAHPYGYQVRIVRGGVWYRAFVSSRHPDALGRAVAIRDRALRVVGEVTNRHRVRGKSNTGVAGISETAQWRHNRQGLCFLVSWRDQGRARTHRFFFGPRRPRAVAWANALRFRERVAGVNLSAFLHQN